jgi:hypothetical protein
MDDVAVLIRFRHSVSCAERVFLNWELRRGVDCTALLAQAAVHRLNRRVRH